MSKYAVYNILRTMLMYEVYGNKMWTGQNDEDASGMIVDISPSLKLISQRKCK